MLSRLTFLSVAPLITHIFSLHQSFFRPKFIMLIKVSYIPFFNLELLDSEANSALAPLGMRVCRCIAIIKEGNNQGVTRVFYLPAFP